MEDKTIIALTRMACGTAILLTSIVTHVDGTLLAVSLILLGVPIELAKRTAGDQKDS